MSHKFIGWERYLKLKPEERWKALEKWDRLSYDHADSWILSALEWQGKQLSKSPIIIQERYNKATPQTYGMGIMGGGPRSEPGTVETITKPKSKKPRCKNCGHRIYSDNTAGMWSHQELIEQDRCFAPGQEGGLCDCTNPEPKARI